MPLRELIYFEDPDEVIQAHADANQQPVEASEAMLLGGGWEKLEGVLDRPKRHVEYTDASVAMAGAVLAEGVVLAHAFENGNKRAASQCLRIFLRANGYDIQIPKRFRDERLAAWMLWLEAHEFGDVLTELCAYMELLP